MPAPHDDLLDLGLPELTARARELARDPSGEALRALAGGDPDGVEAATLFAAAAGGDAAAGRLVAAEAELLARAVATMVLVLDPAVVIIGGGMSRAGSVLLDPVREWLPRLLPVTRARVLSSALGEKAAALGAIQLALQLSDERLYDTALTLGGAK